MDPNVIPGKPPPLGAYPHFNRVGDLVFVSGTSARQADGSIVGVTVEDSGDVHLDIALQTAGVIENVVGILEAVGGGLSSIADVTTFLVDMADFAEYNRVYGEYFAGVGATRTTVAVAALPHPHLLIEMKVIAHLPEAG
jgi:2-aminomuconate deaminase